MIETPGVDMLGSNDRKPFNPDKIQSDMVPPLKSIATFTSTVKKRNDWFRMSGKTVGLKVLKGGYQPLIAAEFRRAREERKKKKLEGVQKIKETITRIEAEEKEKQEQLKNQDIGVEAEFCLLDCCQQYDNPEKLFLHIKKHHDKDATKCALCGKELSSKSSLDRHLLIHAKWQPYKCCHCNKQFSTNGNMHRHKKTHKGAFKSFKFVKKVSYNNEELLQSKKGKRTTLAENSAKSKVQKSQHNYKMNGSTSIAVKRKSKSTVHDLTPKQLLVDKDDSFDFIKDIKVESPPKKAKVDCNDRVNGDLQESNMQCSSKPDVIAISTAVTRSGRRIEKVSITNETSSRKKLSSELEDEKPSKDKTESNVKSPTKTVKSECPIQDSHLLLKFSTPVQDFHDINSYHSCYVPIASQKFPIFAKSICETVERTISPSLHCYKCDMCKTAFPCKTALDLHLDVHKEKADAWCRAGIFKKSSSNDEQKHSKQTFLSALGLTRSCLASKMNIQKLSDTVPEQCSEDLRESSFIEKETTAETKCLTKTELCPERTELCPGFVSSEDSFQENTANRVTADLVKHSPDCNISGQDVFTDERQEDGDWQDTDIVEDGKLVIDCDRDHNDFADITSILSNVRAQPQVNVTDLSLRENEGKVCKSSHSEPSVQNQNVHWLPESPESSLEGHFSVETSYDRISDRSPETSFEEESHVKDTHTCFSCKMQFKNNSLLVRHMQRHTKEKHFKCTLCEAKLISKPNALRHLIKVHKEEKGTAKELIVYNIDTEPSSSSGGKTVCEWCGQDFKSNLILEHHKRAITGCSAKPFLCLICRKSFSTKNNGKRHVANHHSDCDQMVDWIVRNDGGRGNESGDSPDSVPDGSDKTNEESDEPLKANSSSPDIERQRESMKELDAAQSLIDMSTYAPMDMYPQGFVQFYNQSGKEEESDTPIAMDAHSPVDLHGEENYDSPLDLSVRAMDLSKNTENVCHEYQCLQIKKEVDSSDPDVVMASINRGDCSSTFDETQEDYLFTSTPLNLVCRERSDVDLGASTSLWSDLSRWQSPYNSSEITSKSYLDAELLASRESSNSNVACVSEDVKPTLVQCDFCFISFANNSNKRRHEKKKHNVQIESNTFSATFSGRMKNEVSKQTKSLLSKKTKEAILTKVNNAKTNNAAVDLEGSMTCTTSQSSEASNPIGDSNESGNLDLASVSSLISTANSPQLKQYLTSDNNCDASSMDCEDSGSNDETEELQNTSGKRTDGKKGSDKYSCSSCNKKFKCKSAIERHSVTHTKERPYKCPECVTRFTTKSNRDRHVKKTHRAKSLSLTPSSEAKNTLSGKKQQNKPVPLVSSDLTVPDSEKDISLKNDLSKPKDLTNNERSQCNKENQRLYMHS